MHLSKICNQAALPSAEICTCGVCPEDPEQFSLCCQAEAKVAAMCRETDVSCITKSENLSKIWDKVKGKGSKHK